MTLDPQPIRNWTLIQSLEHGILLDEAGTPSFFFGGTPNLVPPHVHRHTILG